MIILRQKQYTSLKRQIGAKIARGRVNTAQKIGDYMLKKTIENDNIAKNTFTPVENLNRNQFKNIARYAKDNYGARIMDSSNFGATGSKVVHTQTIKDAFGNSINNLNPKLRNAVNSNQAIIMADKTTDNADLAHELGHLMNSKRKGIFNRFIKRSQNPYNRLSDTQSKETAGLFRKIDRGKYANNYGNTVNALKDNGVLDTGTGFREAFKRLRNENAIVREENLASRNGINFLKKNGSTKEELDYAKNKLKAAGQTYKNGRIISVLSPIQNKIQIPNRRRV
jgi:hypothetical protein